MTEASNCEKCGAELGAGASFCRFCGRKSSINYDFYTKSFFDKSHLLHLFFSPEGRINRRRYFFGFLLLWAVALVAGLLIELVAPGSSTLLAPLGLFIFLPITVLLGIKRMHDTNHPGWFLLFCFVPIVHLAAYGYLFLAPGTTGPNRFGD